MVIKRIENSKKIFSSTNKIIFSEYEKNDINLKKVEKTQNKNIKKKISSLKITNPNLKKI